MRWSILLAALLALAATAGAPITGSADDERSFVRHAPADRAPERPARLVGRAVLPADTFAPGPPAGAALGEEPVNARTPPFPGQPVQGISAVIAEGPGRYLALSDNGFGTKENSADFLLRIHRFAPEFKTAKGGSGTIAVDGFLELHDPDRLVPFPIVNGDTRKRRLTGADFDVESLRRDALGDLWLGDEFGPFLIHADPDGRLAGPPIPLPGISSPQSPLLADPAEATLPRSRGLEGMAISPDGQTLFPMLEGALVGDPDPRRRVLLCYDIPHGAFGAQRWQYRVEEPGHAIGDLTALDSRRLLVIERDDRQAAEARFKQVYLVDLRLVDEEGFLVKRQLVDLLHLRDPHGIAPAEAGAIGLGDPFALPFQTIESILPLGRDRLLIINDNNYPFSTGRRAGVPDDTEAVVIRVPRLGQRGRAPAGDRAA